MARTRSFQLRRLGGTASVAPIRLAQLVLACLGLATTLSAAGPGAAGEIDPHRSGLAIHTLLLTGDSLQTDAGPLPVPAGPQWVPGRGVSPGAWLEELRRGWAGPPAVSAGGLVAQVVRVYSGKDVIHYITLHAGAETSVSTFPRVLRSPHDFPFAEPPVVLDDRRVYIPITYASSPVRLGFWERSETLPRGGLSVRLASDVTFAEMNASGDVVHLHDDRIDVTRDGVVRTIVRSGEPAPGPIPSFRFEKFLACTIGDVGHVVFQATRVGPGISPATRAGAWLWDGETIREVIATGDQCPGSDEVIEAFVASKMSVNRHGEVAIRSSTVPPGLQHPRKSVVLHGPPGALQAYVESAAIVRILDDSRLVLATHDDLFITDGVDRENLVLNGKVRVIPGATTSTPVEGGPLQYVFNASGAFILAGRLLIHGVQKYGLVVGERGRVDLACVTGQEFEVRPGDVRRMTGVAYPAINDQGDALFLMGFEGTFGVHDPAVALIRLELE